MKLRNLYKPGVFQALILLAQLIVAPVLMNALGEDNYGIYAYIFTIFALVSFLDLGLSPILIREINNLRDGSLEKLSTIRKINELVAILIFFVVSVVLYIKEFDTDGATFRFDLMAACSAALTLSIKWIQIYYTSCLKALVQHSQILSFQLITFVASNVIYILIINGGLAEYIIVLLAASLIELLYFKSRLNSRIELGNYRFDLRTLNNDRKFGIGITLTTLLASLYKQGDRLILSELLPMKYLGYYHAVSLIFRGLSVLPSLINSMYFSYLSNQKRGSSVKASFNKHFLLTLIYSFTCFGTVYSCAEFILRAWLNISSNTELTNLLAILAIAYFVNTIVGVFFNLYISQGKSSLTVLNNLVAVLVFLPASYLLIREHGILGLSYSWMAYNLAYLVIFGFAVSKKILDTGDFFRKLVLLAGAISVIVLFDTFNNLEADGLIKPLVNAVFFFGIGMVCIYAKRKEVG